MAGVQTKAPDGERRRRYRPNVFANGRKKAKPQKLFVRLSEQVGPDTDLKSYLQCRMGDNSIDFSVGTVANQNSENSGGTTKIVLQFPSQSLASKAMRKLRDSNRRASSKVHCFLTEEEEQKLQISSKEEEDRKMKKHLKEILESARSVLDEHDTKLRNATTRVAEIEDRLGRRRGLSLDEFEVLTSERRAREDKSEELSDQRKEFISYLSSMKLKLEEIKGSSKVDSKIYELRKYFGVECLRLKTALPIYARRTDILSVVKDNQVSVILGETGSGKSTQMVQYIHQAGLANEGMIACTQPRKIAAVSLATHVASEMATSVGQIVGYQVGMQRRKTALTKILYMTDHVLLNECLKDNSLSAFSCVIIDEAHERSIYTDLLLGMLKACMQNRPELRVIVTSATINPDVFVEYFGGPEICPVLQVSGRTFPVSVHYEDDAGQQPFTEAHEAKAVKKSLEVHTSCPVEEGDILCFLTSPPETERCCEMFESQATGGNFHCLQLHGKLQPEEQNRVFQPCPKGKRKIVFATNSAETSVTIPGIKFVIDTGLAKIMRYDPKRNMNTLSICPVSKSSAEQRKGRAGRVAPGVCHRLYSEGEFKAMEENAKPEILRVHLGQAILKLLELGVNPLLFDFVESPSKESLEDAMSTLEDIDAVKDGRISELGKWIAKLPLEPRLGALVHHGIRREVPIETLVVAACCNSGGIFFRAGSEAEKKEADVRKTQFCHFGGDLLTMLNVFRAWHEVGEKAKGKWCRDNSINGKSMKGIREVANEVLTVLRKDMKEEIKFAFRPSDDADTVVQGLIIENMKHNLSYFRGHEQAGYVTKKQREHVNVFPASSVKALGQVPQWLVYSQVLQTSRTFVTNVTPVNTELLEKASIESPVPTDVEDLEEHCVSLAGKISKGSLVFKRFIGPKHKNRREVEEEISTVCEKSLVILEADRELGEIRLYCNQRFSALAMDLLKQSVESITTPLRRETVEQSIGNPNSGVRAVLGEGGGVVEILMPHQYRTVSVKLTNSSPKTVTELELEHELSQYGDISQIIPFKKKVGEVCWGKVIFQTEQDAQTAVQANKRERDPSFTLIPNTFVGNTKRTTEFTLKMTWIRRRSRGFGYVTLNRPEDLAPALSRSSLLVGGSWVSVQRSKRESDLYLKGLPFDTNEDDIKAALGTALGVNPGDRFLVKLPREAAPVSENEKQDVRDIICRRITQYVPEDSFRVNVLEVKPVTARGTAFVMFTSPDDFQAVSNHLTADTLCIHSNPVKVIIDLKASVFLPRRIYFATKDDLEEYLEQSKTRLLGASIVVREMKSGNFSVDIKATSTSAMAAARVGVNRIVQGDILECGVNESINKLFTQDARERLKEIEKDTGAVVFTDYRVMTVMVQGSESSRTRAMIKMNEYLGKVMDATEKQVHLKGQDNPVGLMKALVLKYGTDLGTLKAESTLLSLLLNHRNHIVSFTGRAEAIEKAVALVEKVKEEVCAFLSTSHSESSLPECPICFYEIDQQELIRLEVCGHPYCQPCLKSLVQSAHKDRSFPMTCAAEDCGQPLVLPDIKTQVGRGTLTLKAVTQAAVSCYVGKNQKDVHYCITPDCEMVYRITSDGVQFQCSQCGTRMCTTCHIQYHDGLTCAMYESAKSGEGNVENWIKGDPTNRKRCPSCKVGIEKISGCNHMTCSACNAHICWVCLAHFTTSSACYGHLSTAHMSFV